LTGRAFPTQVLRKRPLQFLDVSGNYL